MAINKLIPNKKPYLYNIRGWLTDINDPDDLGTDKFAMNLFYTNADEMTGINHQNSYNGNIAGMKWSGYDFGSEAYNIKGYGFTYDDLNRLTAADYGVYNGSWSNPSGSLFDVNITNYDKNGNIVNLNRYGSSGIIDNLTYSYIGNQLGGSKRCR